MADITVKLNSKGVQEMLHDAGRICYSLAQDAAKRCGNGYVAEKRTYPERTGAIVKTDSATAARDNMQHNTILKAVGKR